MYAGGGDAATDPGGRFRLDNLAGPTISLRVVTPDVERNNNENIS